MHQCHCDQHHQMVRLELKIFTENNIKLTLTYDVSNNVVSSIKYRSNVIYQLEMITSVISYTIKKPHLERLEKS